MTTAVKLADELLDTWFDAYPLDATAMGIRGRDDRLGDYAPAGEDAVLARIRDVAARARALDPANLSTDDRVTRAVLLQQAEAIGDRISAQALEYTVTDWFSAPVAELMFMLPMVTIAEQAHADGYLARLAALPQALGTIADRQRGGVARGRPPVRHQVEAAVAYLDRYLANPTTDGLRRPAPPADGPVDGRAFRAERDRLLDEAVRPALARYRDALAADILPHGRPADQAGLCWLPGGDATYARLVRLHTSTDRTPEELHQTGLDVMARLAEEYIEIGSTVFGTGDLAEVLARLRTDPALRWKDGDELLDAARAAVSRAEDVAPQWFGRLPSQRCTVEPVPADEAPGAAAAYYLPPSLDGTRVGTYFANTYKAAQRDRYSCEATAFHEAVPGHHFQITLALELPDLPLLRRIAWVTAYTEGWGLYAERLADEMGLYADAVGRLGMVTTDAMRAARLVVDTGLHAKGWSRQQAVDYMATNTAMAPVEIEFEVDRYISDPGQALSYMVGRLEIQRIRAEAERTLGDRFDIRAFHDTMLGHGPLPLGVLDEVVRDWTADRAR